MKGTILAVLALAATANARTLLAANTAACQQAAQQIQQLQQQSDYVQQQVAQCGSGGNLEPYNPTWAPWPTHSWPDATTSPCVAMSYHAQTIQNSNNQNIQALQASMNQQGC